MAKVLGLCPSRTEHVVALGFDPRGPQVLAHRSWRLEHADPHLAVQAILAGSRIHSSIVILRRDQEPP